MTRRPHLPRDARVAASVTPHVCVMLLGTACLITLGASVVTAPTHTRPALQSAADWLQKQPRTTGTAPALPIASPEVTAGVTNLVLPVPPPVTGSAPPLPPAPVPSGAVASTTALAPTAGPVAPGGIVLGPSLPAAPTAETSAAPVLGFGGGGCGLIDVSCHVKSAINGWFAGLVTAALAPSLNLLAHTLLSTPDLAGQGQVAELWQTMAGIADALLVLFILAGGALVMGHETVQTRTAAKDIAPRIVIAAISVNASLSLATTLIAVSDSLAAAVLGPDLAPDAAGGDLVALVSGALTGNQIFLVLLGLGIAVLVIALLATFVLRLMLLTVLITGAPLALVCHALPQTEALARLWWRAFTGCLLVQVAQSLVIVTALRTLNAGGPELFGITSSGGLVDLLLAGCLFWVLLKIPSWVSRSVLAGSPYRGRGSHALRDVVVWKALRAVAV